MVAVPYSYTDDYSFKTTEDKLPPQCIEAEEAVLGGILLDLSAIYRVKDRLRTEHFYIGAHKDIYQACIRLAKDDQPTDLIHVTSWLSDHDLLARIGGRNKLATLVDRTVSAVNIDAMANLIISKYKRRELIRAGNKVIELGYDNDQDLIQIFATVTNKIKAITDTPFAPTKDENLQRKHKRLLEELITIYTTCSEPSFRFFRLHELAKEESVNVKFLENLYLKSLTAQCSNLLNYEELKELAGSTVREWLLNGLVPKSTTILLAADGGIGKTKLAYGVGKTLIQGDKFGHFHATGKRKILYYQGDESPGDMLQALDSLGYSEDDIGQYVRVRFGWSAENMPTLIQDLQEFQPDFVVIDSLSTANKYSTYQESQMEYARPILEMTGLATQYKTTILIIHHTNRDGGVRGTTAIRNAVSEVWLLSKDKSETATPYDRILEINKSRSRSSGKKYRLMFSPEDLSFTFLGEESEQGFNLAEQSARDALLNFFSSNRNIRFTSKELAHRSGYSDSHTRNCLSELAADGLISVERRLGQAYQYYLVLEAADYQQPSAAISGNVRNVVSTGLQEFIGQYTGSAAADGQHPSSDHQQPISTPHQHPSSPYTASNTADAAGVSTQKSSTPATSEPKKKNRGFASVHHQQQPEPLQNKDFGAADGGADGVLMGVLTAADGVLESADPQQLNPASYKNIEVGGIYLSRSLGKKVKVSKLYLSVKKADVHVAGDAIAKPRLSLADLYPLPDDSWSPNVGQLAMYGGDLVAIVGYDSTVRKFQVEFQPGRFQYVKAKQLTKP